MILIFIIGVMILALIYPIIRCFIFNIHNVMLYSIKDIYDYFKHRKWNEFNLYGIDVAIGYFGQGKTAYIVRRAMNIYSKYGNKVKIISNVKLTNIPYEPLVNFQQLVDLQEIEDERLGTVVLIDEISNLLSHRNYSNFPMELLGILTQPRKTSTYILATSQRWFMIDKIFRSLVRYTIDLKKHWRFESFTIYDSWDYETALNSKLIKSIMRGCYFLKNNVFNAYDTYQKIDKNESAKFISNEESLVRKGLGETNKGIENLKNPTRKVFKKITKK